MDIEVIREQLKIAEDAIHKAQNELPPPADTIVVLPGDDIQSVIDSAEAGAIIEFMPGKRYVTGSLTIPNKPITLRCHGNIPDRQVHPDDSLPILASGGPFATIDGSFATGVMIQGLYFEARDSGEGEVIILEEANNVTFDRIVIIGNPTNGCKRGIRGNGEHITLKGSYIANIWKHGQDSQCFCAWSGAGPFDFHDCYFEAASENVMFGGADNASADLIPSNITITNCTFTKRDEWRATKNFYAVKNLFELKMARFVSVKDCVFEKNWADAQSGFGIVLKSANQDGGSPWAVTEHVTFEDCVFSQMEHGLNLLGHESGHQTGQMTDINFINCHIITDGIATQIGGHCGEINIVQCTFENGYNFMNLYSEPLAADKLKLHNTRGNHNRYGVKGDSEASGIKSINRYIGNDDWSQVLLLNPTQPTPYPPTTYFTEAEIPPGVIIGATV